MAVILHCLVVIAQVEVSIAKLTEDGAERSQVVRARTDRCLEERDSRTTIARLAETFPLQCELQTHVAPICDVLHRE